MEVGTRKGSSARMQAVHVTLRGISHCVVLASYCTIVHIRSLELVLMQVRQKQYVDLAVSPSSILRRNRIELIPFQIVPRPFLQDAHPNRVGHHGLCNLWTICI